MAQHRELRSPIEAAGSLTKSTATVAGPPLSIRLPSTLWIVLAAILMILAAVVMCSRWSIRGLLPPLIDESGRSQLDANYSAWEVAFPSISLDIPRLATAASRGEDDWSAGNPPATATFTPLPPAAVAPTSSPTPTVQPTVSGDTGGGSTGGGSSGDGGSTGGDSNPPPATSQPPTTATPGDNDSGGGSGNASCGSSCNSDGDCAGLGQNPVCSGGSCYDAQACSGGGGGGGNGGGGGGSNPTPPSGVDP